MPGTNLTRDEARTRAGSSRRLLHRGPRPDHRRAPTFGVHDRDPRSRAAEPGAEHLRRPGRRHDPRADAQRRPLDPAAVYDDTRIQLDGLGDRQRAAGRRRLPLQPHRRGPAPLRRPGRRPGLPLHAVRGAGRPPGVHHLRAARPQGGVHLHRHRARAWKVISNAADPRARRTPATARRVWRFPHDRADVDVHHRARGRRVPRGPATPTPARTARSRWATTAASRWRELPRRRRAARDHQAGLRVLRGRLRLPLPVRQVRPGSTCRSTTWARWRTPAA